MLTVIVILFYCPVLIYDHFTEIKKTSKRGKVLYYFLIAFSFVILVLYSLDVKVPSPNDVIKPVIDAIFHINK